MAEVMGIEARLAWALIVGEDAGKLEDPSAHYGAHDELDLLSAQELLGLLLHVRNLLKKKGYGIRETPPSWTIAEYTLYITRDYHIFLDSLGLKEVPLQPLLKTVFILFLRHPEGIRIKDKSNFEDELMEIYERICPFLNPEVRARRIRRLTDPSDNSFSEKLSNLNKAIDRLLGADSSAPYRVSGANGQPRRIPLDPMYVIWD